MFIPQLNPPNRLKQQLPPVPDALKPVVGVSVMLRKEDMVSATVRGSYKVFFVYKVFLDMSSMIRISNIWCTL